uniref:NADH-ubiquinone oxidoreductase chain 6 n=2 Tax=Chlorophthalmus TaxID=68512 RepID=A0AA51RFA7_9TELE|nr:NADH dehydrogenase subunit 6 [Chlorophthalmus agassizi]WMN14054.1 NADH dehydrogenase subunit 6 [Chlorophthalmus sp. AC-2023]BAB70025.1 NADH dehydrogenase subunit 6 [Chlorophthalmus agassizi]
MTYFLSLLMLGFVVGVIAVASSPAPFFAALGVVVAAAFSCGMLSAHGGCFLSLVLFLIYLGGMLVVVAYSAALTAEPFPATWGDRSVMRYVVFYTLGVLISMMWFWGGWYGVGVMGVSEVHNMVMLREDVSGVAWIYSFGGGLLVGCAWALMLVLIVVLELTRGLQRGPLRSV